MDLLSDFIESSQGCVVKFSGMHYEAIITKNKSNSANKSALPWPRSASLNIWNADYCRKSLCSVCSQSNSDSFIQCDLCKCWVHKLCMITIYDPLAFKSLQDSNPFWYKTCINKTKILMPSNSSFNWFFLHSVVFENKKRKSLLITILK